MYQAEGTYELETDKGWISIDYTVEYSISRYIPASWTGPEEGGEIEVSDPVIVGVTIQTDDGVAVQLKSRRVLEWAAGRIPDEELEHTAEKHAERTASYTYDDYRADQADAAISSGEVRRPW